MTQHFETQEKAAVPDEEFVKGVADYLSTIITRKTVTDIGKSLERQEGEELYKMVTVMINFFRICMNRYTGPKGKGYKRKLAKEFCPEVIDEAPLVLSPNSTGASEIAQLVREVDQGRYDSSPQGDLIGLELFEATFPDNAYGNDNKLRQALVAAAGVLFENRRPVYQDPLNPRA